MSKQLPNFLPKSSVGGANRSLLAAATVTWDGAADDFNSPDCDPTLKQVLVRIKNDSDQTVEAKLFFKDEDGDYSLYKGTDGGVLSFSVAAGQHETFGPIAGWPRYEGGRVKLEAAAPPTNGNTTTVQVQEV